MVTSDAHNVLQYAAGGASSHRLEPGLEEMMDLVAELFSCPHYCNVHIVV